MSKVEEEEYVVISRNDSEQKLSLEVLNKVLWTYEKDKQKYFDETTKRRLGRVLTIIDSAIADETQRKAVKDLVHDAWYSSSTRFDDLRNPIIYEVQEALGIEVRASVEPVPVERYNPYRELV